MRLSAEQALIIKQATRQHIGNKACVLLFCSQTDNATRCCDINLLIAPETPANAFRQQLAPAPALQVALGDQKLDILLLYPSSTETPTHRIAKQTTQPYE